MAADTDAPVAADDAARRRLREAEMERLLAEQDAQEEAGDVQDDNGLPDADVADAAAPPTPPPAVRTKRLSYTTSSFLAATVLLYYALRTRQQWYLALVYLSSSKFSLVVFGNALVALAISLFDSMTAILLNGLRLREAEGLQDFFRWNVTETCLALTMFRSELQLKTAVQFLALIWIKCCHHVAVLRESHLRMTQEAIVTVNDGADAGFGGNPGGLPCIPLPHIKLYILLLLLQLIDLWIVQYTGVHLITHGPSVNILFAFEAAILLISAWSHLLLFYLHICDGLLQFAHERHFKLGKLLHLWKEYKATLTFAVELQAQALQFLFYVGFFAIVLTYYGMPINLFREVFMSFSALKERVVAFLKYRRLMASMDRFQNATLELIEEAGRVCIICRDEMTVHDCKQLPICNHLFHKSCLREWLVQQQSCPTCRSDITANEALLASRNAAARAAAEREEQEPVQDEQDARSEDAVAPAQETVATQESPALRAMREPTTRGSDPVQNSPSALRSKRVRSIPTHRPAAPALVAETTEKTPTTNRKVSFDLKVLESLSFPALYKVVQESGAPVWTDRHEEIQRVIPLASIVLCVDAREGPDGRFLLRIPDGWIPEDDVLRVQDLSHSIERM